MCDIPESLSMDGQFSLVVPGYANDDRDGALRYSGTDDAVSNLSKGLNSYTTHWDNDKLVVNGTFRRRTGRSDHTESSHQLPTGNNLHPEQLVQKTESIVSSPALADNTTHRKCPRVRNLVYIIASCLLCVVISRILNVALSRIV